MLISGVTMYDPATTFAIVPAGPGTFMFTYSSVNLTCARFCPVRDTQMQLYIYPWLGAAANYSGMAPMFKVPNFNVSDMARYKRNFTVDTANLDDPRVDDAADIGTFFQMLTMSIYNPMGVEVAFSIVQFSIQNLCQVLDEIKSGATLNSVIYIMDSQANIIAMSGLPSNSTLRKEILVPNRSPRSIFAFSSTEFPLVNHSSRVVFDYAGRDLKSNFSDSQWRSGGFMFQVSSTTIWGSKYTIVSGAPEEDYLGDTINLSQKLNDNALLQAMQKATKFDFSDISNGTLKKNTSVLTEVQCNQEYFYEMLKQFASALKQNRSLITGTKTSGHGMSGTGNKTVEKSVSVV
ncbi:hypothetical protein M427DRAFT_73833 [Gonapodya prolifera JEL478]|uniref:Uncharacterized protein n=1 Tax=Gonapodya prolifera (strain JEL478) TaxID=1344416 RepID=A0A139A196_GONPJ|nr:hypothetical protein M427DRAFT_73833 [Gonapodya prolifera JEL478]|eukprot:KXS10556.1 hypothetical protein M427DRAFT_73833 [Gonapodya prolifera JEL478]